MFSPWARLSFAVFAVSWGANQFAPMQLVYREHLGLGSGSFAAMLGSYIIGLIPALLYFGRVADRIGRRPVILAMVPVSIVSSVVLLLGAELPLLLYLGRILAGLASGMAFGAGTAWMKELSADAGAGVGARARRCRCRRDSGAERCSPGSSRNGCLRPKCWRISCTSG